MVRNPTLLTVTSFPSSETLAATLNKIVWEESKPSKRCRRGRSMMTALQTSVRASLALTRISELKEHEQIDRVHLKE